MTALPVIRRFTKFGGLCVFKDCVSGASPDFERFNLIYGFNGTGKTTLSRVFASLQHGTLHPDLPQAATFEAELTDTTKVSSSNLGQISKQLLVFNTDFIDANFGWREGTARPVFLLGKEQIESAGKLEAVRADLTLKELLRRNVAVALAEHEKRISLFRTDRARTIAEQLMLGRKYDATNLSSDLQRLENVSDALLPEDEFQRLLEIGRQDAPLDPIKSVQRVDFQASQLLKLLADLLPTTLGKITIDDLQGHEPMLGWIRDGISYHQKAELNNCLFCASVLGPDRLNALAEFFDGRFDAFRDAINQACQFARRLALLFDALPSNLPSINDVTKPLQDEITAETKVISEISTELARFARVADALLEAKSKDLSAAADFTSAIGDLDVSQMDLEIGHSIGRLNLWIEKHNQLNVDFFRQKSSAAARLRDHMVAKIAADHKRLRDDLVTARANVAKVDAEIVVARDEELKLTRELRKHAAAAPVINNLIKNYLGHDYVDIVPHTEGYQLRRGRLGLTGKLSEGEKTALALCYFLTSAEAEGRKIRDSIIVVDDPVSSLDTKSLNYCFALMRAAFADAGQLVILTHNLYFMNECKKWLKPKARPAEKPDDPKPTAALRFLKSVILEGDPQCRETSIVELPKYIRDYDSEYHYLFHTLLRYLEDPHNVDGGLYILPNAMRKILDIFLAFQMPGPNGLANKIDAICKDKELKIDAPRVMALEKLVQLESHADSLDDLVSMSSMTIEETTQAAEALLSLMGAMDANHLKRLKKICS